MNVDRVPFNRIPQDWAFNKDLQPFVQDILDILNQLRERSGGDGDAVEGQLWVDQRTFPDNSQIEALRAEIGTLRRENRRLQAQLDQFMAEVITNG